MIRCNSCGANNNPGSKFCGACGAKLPADSPAGPVNTPVSPIPGNVPPAAGVPPLPGQAPAAQQPGVQPAMAPPPPVRQGPPPPPGRSRQAGTAVQPSPSFGPPPPGQTNYDSPPGAGIGQGGAAQQPKEWVYEKTAQLGMQRNIAALLCYAFGWLSGLIMFFAEKDAYVRFHAAQSVAIFGGIHLLTTVLGIIAPMFGPLWALLSGFISLLSLASLVIWIVMMYKAYNGEYYKAPLVGDLAEQYAKNHPN